MKRWAVPAVVTVLVVLAAVLLFAPLHRTLRIRGDGFEYSASARCGLPLSNLLADDDGLFVGAVTPTTNSAFIVGDLPCSTSARLRVAGAVVASSAAAVLWWRRRTGRRRPSGGEGKLRW